MKRIFWLWVLTQVSIASGFDASPGICLHAENPTVPPNEVQTFEFDTYEKISEGVRCFPPKGGSVVVSKYKLRGIILYPKKIIGTDPKLPAQLETFKGYTAKYPSTQPFLKPRIETMTAALKASSNLSADIARRPSLRIGTTTFLDASFSKVQEGKVIIRHQDGFTGLPFKDLSDDNIAAINILSDGSWKLFRPTLGTLDPERNTYKELLLSDGTRHQKVSLMGYENGKITLKTSATELQLPLMDVAALNGLSFVDRKKISGWVKDVAFADTKAAEAEFSNSQETNSPRLTEPTAINESEPAVLKVTQAHEDGVLCKVAFFQELPYYQTSTDAFGRKVKLPSKTKKLGMFSGQTYFVSGITGVRLTEELVFTKYTK